MCIAMPEEQNSVWDVRCTPWLGEQDAKEFRDRQNSGHASEAAGGWNGQGSGSLLAVWKGATHR